MARKPSPFKKRTVYPFQKSLYQVEFICLNSTMSTAYIAERDEIAALAALRSVREVEKIIKVQFVGFVLVPVDPAA